MWSAVAAVFVNELRNTVIASPNLPKRVATQLSLLYRKMINHCSVDSLTSKNVASKLLAIQQVAYDENVFLIKLGQLSTSLLRLKLSYSVDKTLAKSWWNPFPSMNSAINEKDRFFRGASNRQHVYFTALIRSCQKTFPSKRGKLLRGVRNPFLNLNNCRFKIQPDESMFYSQALG